MNEYIKYGLVGIFIFVIIYFISKNKKLSPLRDEIPIPDQTELLDIESGKGESLVQNRKRAIFESDRLRKQIIEREGLKEKLYSGMIRPQEMINLMSRLMRGSHLDIPIIPPSIDSDYTQKWENLGELTRFDEYAFYHGFEPAKELFKRAMDFSEWGFRAWEDPITHDTVWAGSFGARDRTDKDNSRRFEDMTKEFIILGDNIIEASRKLDSALEKQAISDLREKGWKFEGYDTPLNEYIT
jgi:hypothetical protein